MLEERLREAAKTTTRPVIRVVNFEPEEVEIITSFLAGIKLPDREDPVRVIVAARSEPLDYLAGLEPPQERLDEKATLTAFRNDLSEDGQVFIEIGSQPDSETLGSLFRFAERDLLSFSDDERSREAHRNRADLFADHAWRIHGSSTRPTQLTTHLSQILESLLIKGNTPAVRPWSAFVNHSVRSLLREEGPWNDESIQAAIRDALTSLQLFPDHLIFDDPTKRLHANVRMALKLNPSNGKHLEDDDLLRRVSDAQFVDPDREPLPDEEAASVRHAMREFISGYGESNPQRYAGTELHYWLQLFEKERTQTRRLGDQVYEHIHDQHPDRLAELEALDVIDGLNQTQTEAAEKLITHEAPDNEDAPLFGLLTSKLRRQVMKVAQSARTVRDPLIGVLRHTHLIAQTATGDEKLHIEVFGGLQTHTVFTRRLFALLYGKSLNQIVEASIDGLGIRLSVDPRLLELGNFTDGEPSNGQEQHDGWGELHLRLALDGKTVATLRWDPKALQLLSFGRLMSEKAVSGETRVESLARLEELAAVSDATLPARRPLGECDILKSWGKRRTSDFERFASEGIDAEELIDHAAAYGEILEQARSEMVPQGAPLSDLQDLLAVDTAVLEGGRTAILGTHPIRLRWFGRKLQRVRDDLIKGLSMELALNPYNDDLYFDWLHDLTPHQQPPAMTPRDASGVNVASGEVGLSQEYRPLEPAASAGRQRWAGGADDSAIGVIVRQVERYMAAFPHKTDGLSLLIVLPSLDTELPARIAKRIRAKLDVEVVLKIHVAAPATDHANIAIALDEVEAGNDNSDEDRATSLMPLFQVSTHDIKELSPNSNGAFGDLEDQIDIAVVPDMFSTDVTVVDNTVDQDLHRPGNFNPLLDSPIRRRYDGPTGRESVLELLPTQPDGILEAWSTLTVRQKRSSPVGDSKNTDFLSVRAQLGEQEKQFVNLHSIAHWVVTVDQLVGRDQIDAMDTGIDVIHVEEGVGSNGAHCLVVSSSSGKEFVRQRFANKLVHDLGLVADRTQALEISGHLFETGRDIAPNVLLEALGLGRTAEEIIGLTALRSRVRETYPVTQEGAIEIYLNLDDMIHWFGGPRQKRADILRLTLLPKAHGGDIEMLVCESKYRTSEDSQTVSDAKTQVEDTIELLRAGFCSQENEEPPTDRDLWYRSLANAVLQVAKKSSDSKNRFPAYREHPGSAKVDRQRMIGDIASGAFQVTRIEGAIFTTVSNHDGDDGIEDLADDLKLVRTRTKGLKQILNNLGNLQSIDDETDESIDDQAATQGMTEGELQSAYQKVFDTFGAHGVSVEKPDPDVAPLYEEGPAFYTLRIKPSAGVAISSVRSKVEELKLSLALTEEQDIRCYTDLGALVFQIPKSEEQRYIVDAEDLWRRTDWPAGELYAPIGVDISGGVVGINFSSSTTPHLLIGGTTGGGKSVALETILRGLSTHYSVEQLRLDLVDAKTTELQGFKNDPHLNGPIAEVWPDAAAILVKLVDEMQDRYAAFKTQEAKNLAEYNEIVPEDQHKPWRVLVLDEYTDLVETAGSKDRQQLESPLIRLTSKGRAAGIHVIVSTQQPKADILKTAIRSNLPAKLALMVDSNTDSRIIMDEAGAETLTGDGDALLRKSKHLTRIQCAMYSGSSH